MYTIVANGDNISSGINFYLVDTKEQLNNLYPRPGSKAYVISNATTYILSHRKTGERWVEYKHVLVKYVDDAIQKALESFTGDVTEETILEMISKEIASYNWEADKEFQSILETNLYKMLEEGHYITEADLEAKVQDLCLKIVPPMLKDFLTKEEAARRFVQVHGEVDNDINLVYVTGVTLTDI